MPLGKVNHLYMHLADFVWLGNPGNVRAALYDVKRGVPNGL